MNYAFYTKEWIKELVKNKLNIFTNRDLAKINLNKPNVFFTTAKHRGWLNNLGYVSRSKSASKWELTQKAKNLV